MSSLGYTNLTSIEETYKNQNGIVSLSSNPKDKDLNKSFIAFNQNINNRTTNDGGRMNGGGIMNDGRIINGMNGSAFHLFESGNKPFKSSNTYYSSLMEKSQKTSLASIFFSAENKSRIISRLNEKKCNIDKIMSDEFDQHISKDIYNTMSENDVLINLNNNVVEKCIQNSYMNQTSNSKYIKDVTTLAPPMNHPKSTNKSSTLEFKSFF